MTMQLRRRLLKAIAFGGVIAAAVAAAPPEANDLIVVDCRLPPKVRKLGTQAVFQVAGQVIRTPAKDCEIRGGEYTLEDPGTYTGAIKLWTPGAEKGDPVAQTNLGALLEKQTPPDYAAAVGWYRKAAEQNYVPAEIALGEEYELGRGVPKDEAGALNLYRRASGISERELNFIAPAEEAPPPPPPQPQPPPPSQSKSQSSAPSPSIADRLAKLAPPSIEIAYPLATSTPGDQKLHVRAQQTATTVIGRVVSPAGIDQLTLDTKPIKTDQEGYFTIPPAALPPQGVVHLAARDVLGRNATVDVVIAADPATNTAQTAKPELGNFVALIIGNSKFDHWDQIDNAANDAAAIDQVLRSRYGFKTTLLVNATRLQMLEAFNQLRETLKENDNLLVYYAGHGELNTTVDRGYWIPVNAETKSDAEWILNEQITDYLQILPARHILVIADSCYSGVLTRSSVQRPKPGLDLSSRTDAVSALAAKKVRTVMTSGGVQPVLDSGSNGHSIFANALTHILADNKDVLEANRLFDAISPQVISAAALYGYKQTPTYRALTFAGHEGGDFIFVPVGHTN
jgi:Caspase domain/Sel1 repeat